MKEKSGFSKAKRLKVQETVDPQKELINILLDSYKNLYTDPTPVTIEDFKLKFKSLIIDILEYDDSGSGLNPKSKKRIFLTYLKEVCEKKFFQRIDFSSYKNNSDLDSRLQEIKKVEASLEVLEESYNKDLTSIRQSFDKFGQLKDPTQHDPLRKQLTEDSIELEKNIEELNEVKKQILHWKDLMQADLLTECIILSSLSDSSDIFVRKIQFLNQEQKIILLNDIKTKVEKIEAIRCPSSGYVYLSDQVEQAATLLASYEAVLTILKDKSKNSEELKQIKTAFEKKVEEIQLNKKIYMTPVMQVDQILSTFEKVEMLNRVQKFLQKEQTKKEKTEKGMRMADIIKSLKLTGVEETSDLLIALNDCYSGASLLWEDQPAREKNCRVLGYAFYHALKNLESVGERIEVITKYNNDVKEKKKTNPLHYDIVVNHIRLQDFLSELYNDLFKEENKLKFKRSEKMKDIRSFYTSSVEEKKNKEKEDTSSIKNSNKK